MMLAALSIKTRSADSRMAQETRRAIQWGYDRMGPESLQRIIWRLLEDAADTLARLPDRERGWLLSADRSCWPEVSHTYQERVEEENQRLAERRRLESLGMTPEETPWVRRNITDPSAIPRMLTVLSWLQYVRARTAAREKRDKLIVLAMAQGQSIRSVKRLMLGERSDSAARMVKQKVLAQIEAAIKSSCKLIDVA